MTPAPMSEFAAIILSHKRADRVVTHATLRKHGYTGRIVVLVDDLDPTREEYQKRYGEEVFVFDKKAIGRTFDRGDNFENYRSTNYARNASFDVARELGFKYFIQLDDDYTGFRFRFNKNLDYSFGNVKSLDKVFQAILRFYIASGAHSVAIAQGGDFIGGQEGSPNAEQVKLTRKCMNSFICGTDRRFTFLGRLNEDVNTYTRPASTGQLFFTANQVSLDQAQTQSTPGGMTETYLEGGTYVKSFYSVMFQPSSVKVKCLPSSAGGRIHHRVSWKHTAPKILRETLRK